MAYTRVISYKLWYYYTYLVIGLAPLPGLGTGATAVVLSSRLRAASTASILRGVQLRRGAQRGPRILRRGVDADRHRCALGLRIEGVLQQLRSVGDHLSGALRGRLCPSGSSCRCCSQGQAPRWVVSTSRTFWEPDSAVSWSCSSSPV
ncbi:MAG: hypothetical protein R2789_10320 [Microthrixaceae bacterium]